MSKDKLTDYDSSTASNNTDVGGISVAEGMLPSAVNNSLRELTKQLGAFADGTDGIDVLSLADDDASHAIKLQAPSAVTADTTFTLPDGDGTADQVLKTDGSGQLGFADRHSNPSLIINGAMQVAARGTSETGVTTTGVFVLDRFVINVADTAEYTISQSTTTPDGFANSMKWDNTTANASPSSGQYALFSQKIEGQNLQHLKYGTASAQSVTLSFWVRSNKTGTYIAELLQPDASNRHINKAYTISSADTWEHKTITFSGDTSGVINNDNGSGLSVTWWLGAGSDYSSGTLQTSWGALDQTARAVGNVNLSDSTSNEWYITGVKLEVGSTATPFEHRSFAEEWDRCQRYCTVYNVGGGNTHPQNLVSPNHTVPGGGGHNDVANRAEWFMSYPVKRSQPTITVTDPTNMRWLADNNAVQDATGTVSFPVGTGHQNADCFQAVTTLPITEVIVGWIYKGSGTYPVITIDSEL